MHFFPSVKNSSTRNYVPIKKQQKKSIFVTSWIWLLFWGSSFLFFLVDSLTIGENQQYLRNDGILFYFSTYYVNIFSYYSISICEVTHCSKDWLIIKNILKVLQEKDVDITMQHLDYKLITVKRLNFMI